MTQRVVDILEVIEIEIEHRKSLRAALSGRKGRIEALGENTRRLASLVSVSVSASSDMVWLASLRLSVAGHAPEIDRDARGEHEACDQDDPGAVIALFEQPARHRHGHHRQPGPADGHDVLESSRDRW